MQTGNDVLFFDQIGSFFFATGVVSRFFAIEESVAGLAETFPNGVARFVGHTTNGFPLRLQRNELFGGGSPIGAFGELFCFFAERRLFG